MSFTKKPFQELDVLDDFLINALATNPEVGKPFCRRLLSVLLQREIGQIKVTAQSAIPAVTTKHRGVRLDVEVMEYRLHGEDEKGSPGEKGDERGKETERGKEAAGEQRELQEQAVTVYDMEPHRRDDCNLPRRNRFSQANVDRKYLKRGEKDFGKLPNLYVITITDYDPFGQDHMVYSFRNQCRELPQLVYDDGLEFIYFYTKGTHGGCQEIKNMLTYLCESRKENVTDSATKELHEYVEHVKFSAEVEQGYMTLGELIDIEKEEAAREAARETKIMLILELLEECGEIPEALRERLEREADQVVLSRWFKLAARAGSIEEFMEKMDS